MALQGDREDAPEAFADEVSRIRASGALGHGGRLRELFDYLAERGTGGSASQADIAEQVFGQLDSDGDDATVRVYVHRLRKRLDQYYRDGADAPDGRLIVPPGTYALHLVTPDRPARRTLARRMMVHTWLVAAGALLVTAAAFVLVRSAVAEPEARAANAVWQPFLESDRPILVVVGDYYMFGEIDPLNPEDGRLIRDFRVNSAGDLAQMQAQRPDRYAAAEDVGLTYLPLSTAEALRSLMPVLARDERPVSLLPASDFDSAMLRRFNIVYVGLFSGMRVLEQINFTNSSLALGETYDELIHLPSERHFVSGEAQRLASPGYYTDYGYVSVSREPGGGLVAVVAGARDTALRAIAPLVAADRLPPALDRAIERAPPSSFEALYEVTGQQGTDLEERLVLAGRRPDR